MKTIDLTKYQQFAYELASQESKNIEKFKERVDQLEKEAQPLSVNVPLLLVSGVGLGSEGGEFEEIVKKIFFQGKPLTEENVFHMKRELGDLLWYWVNACTALNLDPNDVIAENVHKLESRYPGGFDPYYSENRKPNDL
jgi:NTP pyrophosphatase (non-canonical NTP hydrolase)